MADFEFSENLLSIIPSRVEMGESSPFPFFICWKIKKKNVAKSPLYWRDGQYCVINWFLCMDDSETHQEMWKVQSLWFCLVLLDISYKNLKLQPLNIAVLAKWEDTICKKKIHSYYICKINKT